MSFVISGEKNKLLLAIIFNGALFCLFFSLLTPRFDTNDDVAMMMFSSGFYTGHPSEHLIFINVILGLLLKYLYVTMPNINWYTFMLYSVHFLSMTGLMYSILRYGFIWGRVSIYFLLFLFFEIYALLFLQFTSTAFVAALGGIFLILTVSDEDERKSGRIIVAAILLLVLAGLIRKYSLFMVIVLSIPMLALESISRKTIRLIVVVCLALVLFYAGYWFNNYYYALNKAWSNYIQYNSVRGQLETKLYNTTYDPETKLIFDIVNWNENDLKMFKGGFFPDAKTYSLEKLQIISSLLPYHGKYHFGEIGILFKIVVLNSLVLLLVVKRFIPLAYNRYIYITGLVGVVIILYFYFYIKLPFRILLPICFLFAANCVFFAKKVPVHIKSEISKSLCMKSPKSSFSVFATVIIFLVLLLNIRAFYSISGLNRFNSDNFLRMVSSNIRPTNDKLFVMWGGALNIEHLSPFKNVKELGTLNILGTGCATHSPLNDRILERFSIVDIYVALYEKDNVFLICSEEKTGLLKKYIDEHYKQNIRFEKIANLNDFNNNIIIERLFVYKLHKA